MFRTVLLSLLAALALSSGSAHAQSHLDYLRAGDYPAARAALDRLVGNTPDAALHQAFLEALILQREGDVDGAIERYRQILARRPDFEPARRELAFLLASTGQAQGALYHAETLLATTRDRRLRTALEGFIASQSAGKPRGITTRFAILPSSNANGGTDAETVVIGGLPFVPDPESRAQRATGVNLGATAWNRWTLSDGWTATLAGSLDIRRYDNNLVSDETTALARLDLARTAVRTRLTFGPLAERTWRDDSPYRTRLGFGAIVEHRLRPDVAVGANLIVWRQTHDDLNYLDGSKVTGALTASWHVRPDLTLLASVPFEVESTERAHLDHTSVSLILGAEKVWKNGLITEVSVGYERDSFDGDFPLFGRPREDTIASLGLSFRHRDVRFGRYIPELSVTYQDSRSNIPFFDYDKVDLGLSFTQRF
jgi:hypothetical protein